MFESFTEFHLEVFVGIGLPMIGAMIFIIRHFWIKTKCFYLLEHRLEQLEEETRKGKETHKDIYEKLNEVNENLHLIMGKLDIDKK